MCSLYVAILFLVISAPITYKFTNSLLKKVCVLANKNGCPTVCGLLIHAVVFMLLLRLGMELKNNVYEKGFFGSLTQGSNKKEEGI